MMLEAIVFMPEWNSRLDVSVMDQITTEMQECSWIYICVYILKSLSTSIALKCRAPTGELGRLMLKYFD